MKTLGIAHIPRVFYMLHGGKISMIKHQHTLQWIKHQTKHTPNLATCLHGGASSEMTVVQLTNRKKVAIRQITNHQWLLVEPDVLIKEQQILQLVAQTSLEPFTPKHIAVDPYGDICGAPTLMMSFLDGKIDELPILDMMILELASTLNTIHNANVHVPYHYSAYRNQTEYAIPSWTSVNTIWQQLLTYMRDKQTPSYEQTFIHRDFHLNNVLWNNGCISGVVDWINGCMGPRYIDVAHCRWNLAMTHSTQAADNFLEVYEAQNKSNDRYDVYWDIRALFDIYPEEITVYDGWKHLGVKELTIFELYNRLDAYAESLWEKI